MAHMPGGGRLSPMVCPLAKLGRSSPDDQRYKIRASPASLDQSYRGSPVSLDQGYHPIRASPALSFPSQPLSLGGYPHVSLLRCGSPTSLGRSSPCLDQGYHTLVSPCWPETAINKGKRAQNKASFFKFNISLIKFILRFFFNFSCFMKFYNFDLRLICQVSVQFTKKPIKNTKNSFIIFIIIINIIILIKVS